MRRLGLTLTVLAMVVSSLAAVADPAEATFPGAIGKIAFTIQDGFTTEIHARDFAGSTPVQLTNDTYTDFGPRWSPDGRRIVYYSYRLTSWEIVVMDADGSNPAQLTNDSMQQVGPSWSADGSEIYYVHDGNSIYVMDADGTNVRLLTSGSANYWGPVASPDGFTIAFSRFDPGSSTTDIWTMNTAGADLQRVVTGTPHADAPSWSPDGEHLAYMAFDGNDWEIFVADADGTNATQLTHNSDSDTNPVWSPDGTKIGFESDRDGDLDLWMMNPDGSGQAHLTDHPSSEEGLDWEPVNRPPVAVADSYSVLYGGTISEDLVYNDIDPDGDVLTVILVSSPSHGILTQPGPGSILYQHSGTGTATTDSFQYYVSDGQYTSNTVTVTIDIDPLQRTPIVVGGTGVISATVEEALESITGADARRYAGADRYATAAALSASNYSWAGAAVIAVGDNFPDALAGGVAAHLADGPVLLVTKNTIPAPTADELTRLQPPEIIVLGGTGVISDSVLQALEAYTTGTVRRLAGADRYATAAAVSADTFPSGASQAFLAVGTNFPDALAGGVMAAINDGPILLTASDALPAATRQELLRLSPTEVTIFGGEGVVAPTVIDELLALLPGVTTHRIAGTDRYGTAAAVSRAEFSAHEHGIFYVAVGSDFPDALATVPVAAMWQSPIVLVSTDTVPAATHQEIVRLMP